MTRLHHLLPAFLAALSCLAAPAGAAPVSAPESAFAGAALIDFDGLTQNQVVDTEYSAQGITFSGGAFDGLLGNTEPGDLASFGPPGPSAPPGTSVAANYDRPLTTITNPITLTFAVPVFRLGMDVGTNAPDSFRITVPTGFVEFDTTLPADFVGIYEPAGFTTATIESFGPGTTHDSNQAFLINDLRFQVVPLPPAFVLLGSALLGLAGVARRRQRREARHGGA